MQPGNTSGLQAARLFAFSAIRLQAKLLLLYFSVKHLGQRACTAPPDYGSVRIYQGLQQGNWSFKQARQYITSINLAQNQHIKKPPCALQSGFLT
ncbi:hypothetical protein D3Y59_10315 [Hymenobacter oligotrophus]|uniref:Uncharacterized protein n=1 Tax=Hymenobacter oligotrophus TaxID=2319843 RepID=A0A3B7R0W4_9BACT|nr:hypothetical protein D3Y59_10315 [Hymenobacter oligotrophus]